MDRELEELQRAIADELERQAEHSDCYVAVEGRGAFVKGWIDLRMIVAALLLQLTDDRPANDNPIRAPT